VIIKVYAKTDAGLKGVQEHYKDSRKLKNRLTLKAHGVKQTIDGKVLIISLEKLIEKIKDKGGSVDAITGKMKDDFLIDVQKQMSLFNAEKGRDYEVVFNDTKQ